MTELRENARMMANQMLDRKMLQTGHICELARPLDAKGRIVSLVFTFPADVQNDQLRNLEDHFKMEFPNPPNRYGFVNTSLELPSPKPGSKEAKMLKVDVVFHVPDFSSRFFRGRDKARFLDRQAFHLVARSIARIVRSQQVTAELMAAFPDKRHWLDLRLRKIGLGLCQLAENLLDELKSLKKDKYRDYR